MRVPRQAVTLGAEHERQPLRRVGGELVQADAVVGQGEGGDGEAGVAQLVDGRRPGSTRVHGTWNTVPIETRIARR